MLRVGNNADGGAPGARPEATWPSGRRLNRCRLTVYYSGLVQGVGFRYTAHSLARGYEVTGIVRNLADGRVELVVEGQREELEAFRRAVQDSEVGACIRHETVNWGLATGEFRGFSIVS